MSECLHLDFKLGPLDSLDALALRLKPKVGDRSCWFGTFRDSRLGMISRLYGVNILYQELHTWLPIRRRQWDIEYRLSSLFFNVDSALECFVFMLNAFGFGAMGGDFRDPGHENQVRQVKVEDIIGNKGHTLLRGYENAFARVRKQWLQHGDDIAMVKEQHDASKHRYAIYHGSDHYTDPPPRFFEDLGISDDEAERCEFWPLKRTLLFPNAKTPVAIRNDMDDVRNVYLEEIVERFVQLVNNSVVFAYEDAEDFVRRNGLLD